MLLMGRGLVRREKGKTRGNIRQCACGKPVDGPNDSLVDLRAAFEIGIVRRWGRDRINRHARPVGCHIWNGIHLFDAKSVRVKFVEGCLCEVDGKAAVVVAKVREGSAGEVIDVAHEIDLTEFFELLLENFFFLGVSRIEYGVVNVDANGLE